MLRWYCKNEPSICRVRTEAGGERERERKRGSRGGEEDRKGGGRVEVLVEGEISQQRML